MGSPKQIHYNALLGQRGINLIEQITLRMGFAWHSSNQALEAGLDGFIELRNPSTGEALNSVIFVQSKATDHDFQSESSDAFSYTCDERDLEYWLKGNAPIILICSRPRTNEAYWVCVKEYFKETSTRTKRQIRFSKESQKFDENAASALLQLALPPQHGIYLAPEPRTEMLYSNLLRVAHYPEHIWIASTDYRKDTDIWRYFKQRKISMAGEWFLKEKKLVSFYDLSDRAWQEVCDQGTVERFDTAEWANSEITDRHNDFVRLLNQSLRRKLHHIDIGFNSSLEFFYFRLLEGQTERIESYRSISKSTSRHVVDYYPNRSNPELPGYYRHMAFAARFLSIGGEWMLEITPTYPHDSGQRTCKTPCGEDARSVVQTPCGQSSSRIVAAHVTASKPRFRDWRFQIVPGGKAAYPTGNQLLTPTSRNFPRTAVGPSKPLAGLLRLASVSASHCNTKRQQELNLKCI
jgi:Domain of unknown function (DUF4365)